MTMLARRLISGRSPQAQLTQGVSLAYKPTREFSTTSEESKGTNFRKLRVNQTRLMDTLHKACSWGQGRAWGEGDTETGMSRLALSNADKHARDWFRKTTEELGCTVKFDGMGNIFAVRPGRQQGPPVYAGSHLDTQPNGGRYAGILGIAAGIEMLRVLQENKVETQYPIGVVNWTNGAGARFPISMLGAGVWSGDINYVEAHNTAEVFRTRQLTVKSELQRIGYCGQISARFRQNPMAAYFELNVEQGTTLEAADARIGVVQGVQAFKWFTVDVAGRNAHTGTTPFHMRRDAMLLAAQLITHSHRVASQYDALVSTGILNVSPGTFNTIPDQVRFTLDVRAPSDRILSHLEKNLEKDFEALAAGRDIDGLLAGGIVQKPLKVTWETNNSSHAIKFHPDCIAAVRASAEDIVKDKKQICDIVSGAGHDSVYTNRICPTSMIFVPSKGGISHNADEYARPQDCATGADVLIQSLLRFDRKRGFPMF